VNRERAMPLGAYRVSGARHQCVQAGHHGQT
jgi:hypothetical protein